MADKNRKRFLMVLCLCLLLSVPFSSAAAYDRPHGHGKEVVVVGHDRYHYHDGRFYRPGWFGLEFVLNFSPFGAVVKTLPAGHKTVIVHETPYFYYNNVYYQSCPSGYVVVPQPVITPVVSYAPVVVAQPQVFDRETVTINVPNSNGSYTPITLVRQNNGYVGPQGEYYSRNPTVEQLRVLYGR